MRTQQPRRSRATSPDHASVRVDPTAATDALSAALVAATGEPLNAEQRECLLDPARADEARDMLDDMRDRMGLADEAHAAARTLVAALQRFGV